MAITKPTHTPGPWDVRKIERPVGFAGVYGVMSNGGPVNISMVEATDSANARLIAAAPDLLAAAQEAVYLISTYKSLLDRTEDGRRVQGTKGLNVLRAAILRATGGK